MIKFKYRENGIVTTKEFTKYQDMLRFVAISGIKDEDFISLQFGEDADSDKEVLEGIAGVAAKAIQVADQMDEAEAMMEAFFSGEDDEEEDEDDEDYPEDATPLDVNPWGRQ